MAKKIVTSNYRVIIRPNVSRGFFRTKSHDEYVEEQKELCQNIIKQIERHVDGVRDIFIDHDSSEECDLCGREWEVDKEGIPTCCDDAIKEYEILKQRQTHEK